MYLRVHNGVVPISPPSHLKDLKLQQQLHSRTTAFQENRREQAVPWKVHHSNTLTPYNADLFGTVDKTKATTKKKRVNKGGGDFQSSFSKTKCSKLSMLLNSWLVLSSMQSSSAHL